MTCGRVRCRKETAVTATTEKVFWIVCSADTALVHSMGAPQIQNSVALLHFESSELQ